MALDAALYLAAALYLEAVVPSQHGAPRHPLFLLRPLADPLRAAAARAGRALRAWRWQRWRRRWLGGDEGWAAAAEAAGVVELVRSAEAAVAAQACVSDAHAEAEPISDALGPPQVSLLGLSKDYSTFGFGFGFGDFGFDFGSFGLACSRVKLPKDPSAAQETSARRPRKARALDSFSLDLWAGQVSSRLHDGVRVQGRGRGL